MAVRNKRIEFLKQVVTKDELNQERISWEVSGRTALAEVLPVSGKLYYEAARAKEENTMLFKFRYSEWMSELNAIDYRVLYKGKQYRIKLISNVGERNQEMQLRGVAVD